MRPLRKTAAAYLEVLVVAWIEEKVCLSIIFLEEKKPLASGNTQLQMELSNYHFWFRLHSFTLGRVLTYAALMQFILLIIQFKY